MPAEAHAPKLHGKTSSYKRPPPARMLNQLDYARPVDCNDPPCSEQVHILLGAQNEARVLFATHNDLTPSKVTFWDSATKINQTATGTSHTYSQLLYYAYGLLNPDIGVPAISPHELAQLQSTVAWAINPATGKPGSYYVNRTQPEMGLGAYNNPREFYTSPLIHSVTLRDLKEGHTYFYSVAGRESTFVFTMPPAFGSAAYPLTFGLTADIGQTSVSAANVERLEKILARDEPNAGVVLLAGDISYSDGFYSRWDSFGRMMERFASRVPVMTTGGNHEVGDGEAWQSYNFRYPMPYEASGSSSNLWWSRDIGPVHVVALCSYAATSHESLQYRWLSRDLSSVDRARTPWVIVMMHSPWYTSSDVVEMKETGWVIGHVAEAELMRRDMEPLLYAHGVDIVLSGHIHSYERINPVYNFSSTACGPHYLNLGDGGNREGVIIPWLEDQPEWSAFRESSFGVGSLRIVNSTHAHYKWERSACESSDGMKEHISFDEHCISVAFNVTDPSEFPTATSDSAWIVRSESRKLISTDSVVTLRF